MKTATMPQITLSRVNQFRAIGPSEDALRPLLELRHPTPHAILGVHPGQRGIVNRAFRLHLVAEGHHEELYEKLGAHPRRVEGIDATSFALWAPNAVGVSVVGDLNSWHGRLHLMRRHGRSGIWEIFVPDVGVGATYKYEIRSEYSSCLKTDPFAFAMEVPPKTASVVVKSRAVKNWRQPSRPSKWPGTIQCMRPAFTGLSLAPRDPRNHHLHQPNSSSATESYFG